MQPDRYEREEKASFVDFVVFSLEIDRVRCVPERLSLVRNWCAPSYQLCWSTGYRPGEPYRGFESHSLRQYFECSAFSIGGIAENPSIKLGLSKNQTVPESTELGDLLPGDGIFLQSFVLRRFSTV